MDRTLKGRALMDRTLVGRTLVDGALVVAEEACR